jgi:hypothetical protein
LIPGKGNCVTVSGKRHCESMLLALPVLRKARGSGRPGPNRPDPPILGPQSDINRSAALAEPVVPAGGQVQEMWPIAPGQIAHRWVPRRPMPEPDLWFETVWARFRGGEIYET